MHPGDESDPPVEVRVTDRRRFTDTGDARDGEADVPADASGAQPEAPPRTAPPASEPAPQAGRPAAHAASDPDAGLDLGIEPVFFIFYQSALIALGAPEVVGEAREPDLGEARHAIDALRVLEAKTRGNLTPEEATMLRQLLDDAQMRYVHAARGMAGGRT